VSGQRSSGRPGDGLEHQTPKGLVFQRIPGGWLDSTMPEDTHADVAFAEGSCPEHRPVPALKHSHGKRLQFSLSFQIVVKLVIMLEIGHTFHHRMARVGDLEQEFTNLNFGVRCSEVSKDTPQ